MKKVRDIFCVLLLLCTTMSCENWLDVDPKTEIKSELMFQSVSGFKDALMGVYLTLRDPELYGKEATWGFCGCYWATNGYSGSGSRLL